MLTDLDCSSSRSITFRAAPRAWLLAFGVAAVTTARPATAAPEPSCDLECEKGTTCELISVCPAIYCENAADCPPCTPSPLCVPAACEIDDDCGADQVCVGQPRWDCAASSAQPAQAGAATPASAPAAAPTSPADPNEASEPRAELPAPPPCEPTMVLQCTPRWQLPCTVDADCGEGFSCEQQVVCDPAPPADPDGQPEATPQDTCHPSGTAACIMREIACTSDADCPSSFECVNNPNGACSSSSDGQTHCEPVDPPQICLLRSRGATTATGNEAAGLANANGSAVFTPPSTDDASGLAPELASSNAPAQAGSCSLNRVGVADGWLGLLSIVGVAAAFGARRKPNLP